jgi:predicted anti-sigma-YlaC factor YlaD
MVLAEESIVITRVISCIPFQESTGFRCTLTTARVTATSIDPTTVTLVLNNAIAFRT